MGWIIHILGVDDVSGRWYGFWSGFGSDLGEAGIVVALGAQVRRHNCHVHRCWRIGRHPVAGTTYVVCRRHHPDDHLTHGQVATEHANAEGADR
jgi:hypothetical protein